MATYKLTASADVTAAPRDWTFWGSNDNFATATLLDTQTGQTFAANEQKTFTFGSLPDLMLMDGTSAIKDVVTNTAFTMAGTPATGTLLGATAPFMGAAAYTNCSLPLSIAAGHALSIMFAMNTTWAGNDNATHFLWVCTPGPYWSIQKAYLPNSLVFTIADSTKSATKSGSVDATSWAPGTHIVIATVATNDPSTMMLYLDGTSLTTYSSTGPTEQAITSVYFGNFGGSWLAEGLLLAAMWGRVLTAGEIATLSSNTAVWSQIPRYKQVKLDVTKTNGAATWDVAVLDMS